MKYSHIKAAVSSFELVVADVGQNAAKMIHNIEIASESGAKLIVFPELSITGYTCADLFLSHSFLGSAKKALGDIVEKTAGLGIVSLIGLPILVENRLYNCAAAVYKGRILACYPKSYIPDYGEYYESRYFTSGLLCPCKEIALCGQTVPFGTDIVICCSNFPALKIAAEICEDLWVPVSPSSHTALKGAAVICNLSASNEFAGKSERRRQLVLAQSDKLKCAYIYSSCSGEESSTDLSFSGDKLIGQLGSELMMTDEEISYAVLDLEMIATSRSRASTFIDYQLQPVRSVCFELEPYTLEAPRYSEHPFWDGAPSLSSFCHEVFENQVRGLMTRMRAIRCQKAVVGISGGLDSTLALLVSLEAVKRLTGEKKNLAAVTMPCFGTTSKTYLNSVRLANLLGCSFMDVNIAEVTKKQLDLIGHDMSADVVLENAQARQRTQILMNLANQQKALVVGTSDLSEIAIGFSTYNGDHMSMYNVNASVPKTLVREIIRWYADGSRQTDSQLADTLLAVCNTDISPELLPVGEGGQQEQKTEEIVGKYEVIDFVLYYHIKFGFAKEKILFLLTAAFPETAPQQLNHTCEQYFRRFFANQFKRSCMPDGVKATELSLSPRSDFRLPSDLHFTSF